MAFSGFATNRQSIIGIISGAFALFIVVFSLFPLLLLQLTAYGLPE